MFFKDKIDEFYKVTSMCKKLFPKEKQKSTEVKNVQNCLKRIIITYFLLNYIDLGKTIDHRIKNALHLNTKFMQEIKTNVPALL